MKKLISIVIFILVIMQMHGDFSGLNKGTRSLGMGNAFSAMGEISESVFYNAAGSADIESESISASYQNQYGISDLMNLNLAITLPYKKFVYGLAIQQVNLLDVYSENIFYFNLAWKYKYKFSSLKLGMNMKHFRINCEDDITSIKTPFDFDYGMILQLKSISLAYSNQNVRRNQEVLDHIGSSHILGLAIKWEDLLRYTVDYEISCKEEFFRTGIELWFFDTFAPRL